MNSDVLKSKVTDGVAVITLGSAKRIYFDAEGQPLTTSFMDYLLPTVHELPRITLAHQHSPSPLNPFGVKGVGEGGPIAPPAAIANAVADALRPFKAEFNHTPVAPQDIVAAVREARRV